LPLPINSPMTLVGPTTLRSALCGHCMEAPLVNVNDVARRSGRRYVTNLVASAHQRMSQRSVSTRGLTTAYEGRAVAV
jgi:hypothetical protein